MPSITECLQSIVDVIQTKMFRVFIMFILTTTVAIIEIVYGIRAHSNALIADGLYSFAEGVCLIGVMMVLRHSYKSRKHNKNNTFGYERLELLFGLIQEVFLLSVSLGIIVDAVNHLVNPAHVVDPVLMITLGITGIFVGLIGMIMFWGYHHDHNIEEEINEKRKIGHLSWITADLKTRRKSPNLSRNNTIVETPLMSEQPQNENKDQSENNHTVEIKQIPNKPETSTLAAFTYENVEIGGPKVYATLHALCLHSFVVLLESVIVASSGFLIKFIPHVDPITGKEINVWLKYIDPSLTLIMVVIITVRAVPVIFSISDILIEDVPNGIDTEKLMNEIVIAIPAIKSIHNLHVWRSTASEIYATLHLVCDNDVLLSKCSSEYCEKIGKILKSYCVRYYTLQLEYSTLNLSEQSPAQNCINGIERRRRGHALNYPTAKLPTNATIQIQ